MARSLANLRPPRSKLPPTPPVSATATSRSPAASRRSGWRPWRRRSKAVRFSPSAGPARDRPVYGRSPAPRAAPIRRASSAGPPRPATTSGRWRLGSLAEEAQGAGQIVLVDHQPHRDGEADALEGHAHVEDMAVYALVGEARLGRPGG